MNCCSACHGSSGWLLVDPFRQCRDRRIRDTQVTSDNKAQQEHAQSEHSRIGANEHGQCRRHGRQESGRGWARCCGRRGRYQRVSAYLLLFLCFVAAVCTLDESWNCRTFTSGGHMPDSLMWYIGGGFGVWTVMDANLECQLWTTLFFADALDGYHKAARICSMIAMLVGLSVMAILTHTLPCQWVNWVSVIFFLVRAIGAYQSNARFNLWMAFFTLTYLFMVAAARRLFTTLVRSVQFQRRVVRGLLAVAMLASLGVFFMLASDVCSCSYMKQVMETSFGEWLSGNETWALLHDGTVTLALDTPINSTMSSSSTAAADDTNEDTNTLSQYVPASLLLTEKGFAYCRDSCEWWSPSPFLSSGLWFLSWLLFPYCSIHTSGTGNATTTAIPGRTSTTGALDVESYGDESLETVAPADHVGKNAVAAGQQTAADDSGGQTEAASELVDVVDEEDRVDRFATVDRNEGGEGSMIAQERSEHDTEASTEPGYTQVDPTDVDPSQLNVKMTEEEQPQPTRYEVWRGSLSSYACRTLWSIFILLYLFVVVLIIGADVEIANAAGAPNTSYNFVLEAVCAFNPLDPAASYVTFAHKREAIEASFAVLHCGACAQCSNPDDIAKYVTTRKTVAESAKRCSKTTIFGNYDELNDCLEEQIGFTRPCTECWADNMQTTAKYCLFTCLSSFLTGNTKMNNLKHADDYNWLNQCLFCDEKRSGPAFVTCSGVARRRLGIPSEIERNPAEQCQSVDVDYLNATSPNYFFNYYNR